jgi:penicillin-binding protein activator
MRQDATGDLSPRDVPRVHRRPAALAPARVLLLAGLLAAPLACATKKVSRIDPAAVTDLSGKWNDMDSRLVANQLIEQTLASPWARQFASANGGEPPAVIVGDFANKTMEHIPVATFVRDLEQALLGSGMVRIVASADERQAVRGERTDQQQHARADTRARLVQEQGARYMLQGDVKAIEDGHGREKVVYYQVDATLIDLESNVKVWAGQHKIKKYIERKRVGL